MNIVGTAAVVQALASGFIVWCSVLALNAMTENTRTKIRIVFVTMLGMGAYALLNALVLQTGLQCVAAVVIAVFFILNPQCYEIPDCLERRESNNG